MRPSGRAKPSRARDSPQEPSRQPGLQDEPRGFTRALPRRAGIHVVHVVRRRPYTGFAGSWRSQNIAASASTAGSRGGSEAAAIGRGEKPLHHRAVLTPVPRVPVFCCCNLGTFGLGIGAILHSFPPRNPAHSSGQRGNHGPSAPHTHQGQRMPACAAPYRALYSRGADDVNTEKVTHACATRSEALTHAR